MLFDLGPHLIDQALELLGPARVGLRGGARAARRARRWTTTSSSRWSTRRARARTCGRTMLAAQPGPRLRVLGTRGRLREVGPRRAGGRAARGRAARRPRLRRGARPRPGAAGHRGATPSRCRPSAAATSSSTSRWSGRSARAEPAPVPLAGRHRDAPRDRGRPAERRRARRRPPVTGSSAPRPHPCATRAYGRPPCAASADRRASSGSGSCCCWRCGLAALARFTPRADAGAPGAELVRALTCAARGGCEAERERAREPPRGSGGPGRLVVAPPLVPVLPRERRSSRRPPRGRPGCGRRASLSRFCGGRAGCSAGRGAAPARSGAARGSLPRLRARSLRAPAPGDPLSRTRRSRVSEVAPDRERLPEPGRPRPRLGPLGARP